MNCLFSITGFLAAGMFAVIVFVVTVLPFIYVFGYSASLPLQAWALWALAVAMGIRAVLVFVAFSLEPHWAALRRNAQITPAAWRGVCGIYVLLALALCPTSFAADPSGTHGVEKYCYMFFASCCSVLGVVSMVNGFCRHRRNLPCNTSRQ